MNDNSPPEDPGTKDWTIGHDRPSTLIRQLMDENGWNQKDLAALMQRPSQLLSDILNERKAVTAWTAIMLESATGVPAMQFLNLQMKVNLDRARQGYKAR